MAGDDPSCCVPFRMMMLIGSFVPSGASANTRFTSQSLKSAGEVCRSAVLINLPVAGVQR